MATSVIINNYKLYGVGWKREKLEKLSVWVSTFLITCAIKNENSTVISEERFTNARCQECCTDCWFAILSPEQTLCDPSMKCPLQNANTTAYSIYIVKGAYYRVLKAVAKIKAYSFFCVSVSETRQLERIKSADAFCLWKQNNEPVTHCCHFCVCVYLPMHI